ncbi:orotate phosphoribosyltransferase [Ferroacidibacillus organovorans]|uniref:Orotate phosphoribosyltransferase n=1 Tax=Ferroacidibacillus organovorans TaxID=1765683 RepID=A0A162UK07_9BACL|nr:orotate phosphoribosyltransferase [Ferroacidibacillus organovorans]KYP81819.1 orotate phosphoribosyltransferase [Ferroacidibacillus organovorans]OPG16194.1 orotate phosphoribosyltransferase [Ferroacidibacillus organovorans]
MHDTRWSGEDEARQFARAILSIEAVTLSPNDPYTWSSGMRSPIYCDQRLTLSHPLVRSHIADAFAKRLRLRYPDIELIAGTATGGIGHAAILADRVSQPMVYVRSSAKGHGKQNLIEGRMLKGTHVAVVEDTVSTGGSVLHAVEAIREAGGHVSVVFTIFSYGFHVSQEAFARLGIKLEALTDFTHVIETAQEMNVIKAQDVELLMRFQENPSAYSEAFR